MIVPLRINILKHSSKWGEILFFAWVKLMKTGVILAFPSWFPYLLKLLGEREI